MEKEALSRVSQRAQLRHLFGCLPLWIKNPEKKFVPRGCIEKPHLNSG
jgi:hypothetical protein